MNRTYSLLASAAVYAAAVWWPLAASAGGFIMPSTGGKSAGMAGAWVAQGDDLSVMDHNPAQLVRQERSGLDIHYTAYLFGASFEPDPVEGLGTAPGTRNVGDFLNHIPNLYAGFPVGDRWTLGAAVFSPIGPSHLYESAGPQRYQIQEAFLALVWAGVSAAYELSDSLAASLSLDTAYVMADQQLAFGLVPGYRSLDGSLQVEGAGLQRPRPKVGFLYEPVEDVSLGLVGLPGMDLIIHGTVRADVPQVGFSPDEAFDNITATQRAPSEARLGVGWTPAPFRTEATLRYYRWSEYTEQRIELDENRIGAFTVDDLTVPTFYRDTFALQLGAGYAFLDDHEVRAGYLYDQQAALDEGLMIHDFDAPKHVFALGYGLQFGERYHLDASYNYVWYQPRAVSDSASEAMSVLGEAPVVGNGVYSWDVQTFSVAFGVGF